MVRTAGRRPAPCEPQLAQARDRCAIADLISSDRMRAPKYLVTPGGDVPVGRRASIVCFVDRVSAGLESLELKVGN